MGKQRDGGRTTPRRLGNAGRERPWGLIIVGGILALVLIAFVTVVILDSRQQTARTPPSGVETYKVPQRNHTDQAVSYPQTPPVGGNHNPVWQNCGFYSEPLRNENAVHSMEHGTVWITYQPGLPKNQVNTIKDLAASQDYILASPYPKLDSPVVASAWGKQLKLQSADDPGLEQFVSAYREGPQTPEPGATCAGGTGQPE